MRTIVTSLIAAAAVTLTLGATPARADGDGPTEATQASATAPLPKGVKAKGKTVEQVWTWGDADVPNTPSMAIFSSTDTMKGGRLVGRKIYAQYLRQQGGKWKELRMIQDGVSNCEFDVAVGFVPGSVLVTDADGDTQAELSFLYDVTCTSDVSPSTRKLLVLEGKAKHALRGTSRVDVGGGQFVGGEYKPDGFKKKGALQVLAENRWDEFLAK